MERSSRPISWRLGNELKLSSDRIARIGEPRLAYSGPKPYDPPEAERGVISPPGALSPAGDVWSLGMTCVEVLTQTLPQRAPHGDMVLPPSLPPLFGEIASHCLCIEPNVAGQSHRSPPDLPNRPSRFRRRRPSHRRNLRGDGRQEGAVILFPRIGAAVAVAAIVLVPRLLRRNQDVPGTAQDNASPHTLPTIPSQPSQSTGAASQSPISAAPSPRVTPSSAAISPNSAPATAVPAPAPPSSSESVLQKTMPQVSESARNTIQGTIRVVIRVRVDSSGNVADATFDNHGPSGYFADRAMQAAREWKFAPAASGEWLLRFEFTQAAIDTFAEPATR